MQTSSSIRREAEFGGGAISLSEVISALTYALDLTESSVHGHALRSCLLGMRIAQEAGLASGQMDSLYYALLLKDVALDSDAEVYSDRLTEQAGGAVCAAASRVWMDENWSRLRKPARPALTLAWSVDDGPMARISRGRQRMGPGLRNDRGASILSKLGMGEMAAEAVRSADEHWDGGGRPDGLRGEGIPLLARVCAVARHIDLAAVETNIDGAIEELKRRSGTWFDPELVRAAVALNRRGALWANVDIHNLEEVRRAVLDLDPGRREYLQAAEIDRICEAFADVVDAKSHFTFSHSMGVADAALGIARSVGLAADRVQMVRRAALLHDIGKLSVSNAILDKTSKLNASEWETVRRHPGYTRRILERVRPFREIAVIAGEHHEKLDGSGYPDRLMGADLSLESRIIAVADVYGALSEDRPYRAGLEFGAIVPLLRGLAPRKLDGDCVEALVAVVSSERTIGFASAMPVAGREMIYATA